jgi:glycosyltransferase 2 family protein
MESIVGEKEKPICLAFWLAAIPLLWWSLSNAPLGEIGGLLSNLKIWQIAAVIVINIFIMILISTRWWLILRGMGFVTPFGMIFGYRLASFGVSYFTPGPQFGGEPLQVALLNRNNGVPVVSAASSVYFDKLLELFTNLLVLSGGILFLVGFGLVGDFYPDG